MNPISIKFKNFLASTNNISPISINNYLADLRKFLQWFKLNLEEKGHNPNNFDNNDSLLYLTKEVVNNYIQFLIDTKSSILTINRSLSTLRKFCQFLIIFKLIECNPILGIKNIEKVQKPKDRYRSLLEEYRKDLQKIGLNSNSVINYSADANQFLNFLSKHNNSHNN